MLSSSLILAPFLKHTGILSQLTPSDDQGINVGLSGWQDLAYRFPSFLFGTEKAPWKNTAGLPVLEYAMPVKSNITQGLSSLVF